MNSTSLSTTEKMSGDEEIVEPRDQRSPEEKALLRSRSTAKMIFSRKVSMYREREKQGDQYEALKFFFSQIENKYNVLEGCCTNLMKYYADNDFNDKFLMVSLFISVCSCERHSFYCEAHKESDQG